MQATPDSAAAPTPTVAGPEAADAAAQQNQNQRSLLKNTAYLTMAQAATIPIAVAQNALIGRYLGSAEYGYWYVASQVCAFAVLAFEWGQQGAVTALVARDHSKAGIYLGTSLAFRTFASMAVSLLLAPLCLLLGYEQGVLWAIGLAMPIYVLNSFVGGMKDTIRGFERTDIPALVHVSQQIMTLAVMAPVLMLGGKLRAVLLSMVVVSLCAALFIRRFLKPVGIGKLHVDRSVLRPLVTIGTPFVFFDLAMVVLPNVNATFLAKLVPAHVIGWYGVSQRLIGLLLFPASALIGALYPTLCRLHTENHAEFVKVSRSALYGVALLAMPAAVGTGMFPELGVAIFGSEEFSGANDHLRVMSVFVLLVYFSMPLGTSILAANRQRVWALVQCFCIVVSLVGSPFLIPYFQERMHNGAIGTCVMLVISELFVVLCGVALSARGLFDRGLAKSLALALLAGIAMAGVAWFTKPISIWLAVPAAVLTYGGVAYVIGAIQPSTLEMIKGFINRKLKRA